MLHQGDVDTYQVQDKASEIGNMMLKQIDISMIDPAKLKNNHNSLFLNIMETLEITKEHEHERVQL